jgi:hypothetical protein
MKSHIQNPRRLRNLRIEADLPEGMTLDLGDSNVTKVKIISERDRLGAGDDPALMPTGERLWVCGCAIYDGKKNVVYTWAGASAHNQIMRQFDLESSSEQDLLNKLIFGFVTGSGHFFNREAMEDLLRKHHPNNIRKAKGVGDVMYNLNSEWIDWRYSFEQQFSIATAN